MFVISTCICFRLCSYVLIHVVSSLCCELLVRVVVDFCGFVFHRLLMVCDALLRFCLMCVMS